MIDFPNAKINLGLNVISKRPDGYHNLQSIFVPVDWCDILEIIPAEKDIFYLNQEAQDLGDRSNLVLQALDLLRKDFEIAPLEIHLTKIIPIGAGLGGGSADTSFMLKLLNELANLNLTDERLENYAAILGSDCPFFIQNKNSLVEGRGEYLKQIDAPQLKGISIVLINPQIHISTKEAYDGIVPQPSTFDLLEIINTPIMEWQSLGLENDFEGSIFKKYPEIESIKNYLYETGASYASMSGSGSTVFGLFEGEIPKLETKEHWVTFIGKTL